MFSLSKKYIANAILAILIVCILLGIDFTNRIHHSLPLYPLHFNLLLLISLSLTFLVKNRHFLIICGIMFIMLFIQMVYFGYFGTPVSPIDISLFFTHKTETIQSLNAMTKLIWFPIGICSLAFVLIYLANTLGSFFC